MTIDWKLLRAQKQRLVEMPRALDLSYDDTEVLKGIVHLIDAIQDDAVESGQVSPIEVFGDLDDD